MIRYKILILTSLLCFLFISIKAQSPFRSALIGKNVSETPLSEYIKEESAQVNSSRSLNGTFLFIF